MRDNLLARSSRRAMVVIRIMRRIIEEGRPSA